MNRKTVSGLGVHACGKTSIFEMIAEKTGKECADVDKETAKRVLQLLDLSDFKNEFGIDEKNIPNYIKEKIENGSLVISDYSKIVPDWHLEGGFFRRGETKTLKEMIKQYEIIITGGGTGTVAENMDILKPTVKIVLVVSKEEQAKRLRKDVEGNARRGLKNDPKPGCNLSHQERLIQEIAEFNDKWTPVLRGNADHIVDVDDKSRYDIVSEILEIPQIQDVFEYNP